MTIRLCRVCRGWHDPHEWPAECIKAQQSKAAAFPTPMFISDTMDPVQSQVDGKTYDSKAAIRAHYRASGVVEVGTDKIAATKRTKPPVEATVAKALSIAGL